MVLYICGVQECEDGEWACRGLIRPHMVMLYLVKMLEIHDDCDIWSLKLAIKWCISPLREF